MKAFLKKQLHRYKYPQYLFAKKINERIHCMKLENDKIIIDAPCGGGETSYWLAKENQSAQVFGFDIDELRIKTIPGYLKNKNLHFAFADIYNMPDIQKEKVAVFCLINSLFLLPDNSLLIKKLTQVIYNGGHLFLIIPNIDGQNYKNFMKTEDNHINIYEYSVKSLIDFVSQYGFSHVYTAPLAYAHFYGRKELKYFKVFFSLYLHLLNIIQTIFKAKQPSYWLVEFKKMDSKN